MHLNFKVYNVTVAAIIAALAIAPCVMFLPESYGFENGVLENLQLIVLFLGFIFALMAKDNKKFFYFVAMIIAVLAIREVNCFRTVFFAIPGEINEFYTWDQIKFGWLYHPIYGLFIAYVAFYFLKNKLFLTAWEMLKNIKLPVWNILLMLSGMLLGVIMALGGGGQGTFQVDHGQVILAEDGLNAAKGIAQPLPSDHIVKGAALALPFLPGAQHAVAAEGHDHGFIRPGRGAQR